MIIHGMLSKGFNQIFLDQCSLDVLFVNGVLYLLVELLLLPPKNTNWKLTSTSTMEY